MNLINLTCLGINDVVLFFERFEIFDSLVLGTLFKSNVSNPAWRIMYSLSRSKVSIFAIKVKLMLQGVQN
jgi:hypothetical protein